MTKKSKGTKSVNKSKLYAVTGSRKPLLKELTDYIESAYQIEGVYKCSKDGDWTVFYRKSGKALCYINLFKGGFKVTVVIGASLADKVKNLKISAKAKKMFSQAKQYYDGKWMFFDVASRRDISDIKELLALKRKPEK